ncbi:MAG: hypothetical protein KAS74_04935 [Methanosarcinales archaeon]|nr:hypothetical protein [Methanosarcinales archaeon]
MYNCIAEVLHGIWSLVVNHREYPIIPKGGEDMISGANNASGNILQNRAIPNTAPDRLLSRVCMFTIMLLYTATITVRSSGCNHTTIQAAADAANEDE